MRFFGNRLNGRLNGCLDQDAEGGVVGKHHTTHSTVSQLTLDAIPTKQQGIRILRRDIPLGHIIARRVVSSPGC